jgi:lysozyme family protein
MALIDLAIPTVLRHEGGFADVAGDPGGVTNFGVSLRWLKAQGLLDELEIEEGDLTHDQVMAVKTMTRDEAMGFYEKYWWGKYQYTLINPQAVATKIFDMAVNLGAPRAHRLVQIDLGIAPVDGVIGAVTLHALNTRNSLDLILGLQNAQAQFYKNLVLANPARQKFLKGWLGRAYDQA